MATGKHIGKVVLRVREEEAAGAEPAPAKLVSAIPRTYMHPAKSYVLVGTYMSRGETTSERSIAVRTPVCECFDLSVDRWPGRVRPRAGAVARAARSDAHRAQLAQWRAHWLPGVVHTQVTPSLNDCPSIPAYACPNVLTFRVRNRNPRNSFRYTHTVSFESLRPRYLDKYLRNLQI